MTNRQWRKYLRRGDRPVTAVQLALDMDPLVFRKWGGVQRALANDWLVNNNGDVYTVAAASFASTYHPVDPVSAPGQYIKSAPVWACEAADAGAVETREGRTAYQPGDFIVANAPDGDDRYAISRERFHDLYILAETPAD